MIYWDGNIFFQLVNFNVVYVLLSISINCFTWTVIFRYRYIYILISFCGFSFDALVSILSITNIFPMTLVIRDETDGKHELVF